MSGVRHADSIYVLNQGRLAEHGSHDELIAIGGRYAAMFHTEVAQYAPVFRAAVPQPGAPPVPKRS